MVDLILEGETFTADMGDPEIHRHCFGVGLDRFTEITGDPGEDKGEVMGRVDLEKMAEELFSGLLHKG